MAVTVSVPAIGAAIVHVNSSVNVALFTIVGGFVVQDVAVPDTLHVKVPPGVWPPEPVIKAVTVIVCPTVGALGDALT